MKSRTRMTRAAALFATLAVLTFRRRARWIAANLQRFQAGEPLHNIV